MIKLEYETENGKVEANFETLDELERFQESLREKNIARQKKEARRLEAVRKAKEDAESRRQEELRRKYDELHAGMKDILLKAKDYGMTPEGVVELITKVLTELVDNPVTEK